MQMTMRFPGGLAVDAEYKGFTIRTDQPVKDGGEGTAPAPFDLFVASLGTCAGYYVMRFLQKRGLPLEGVEVTLETEKDRERKMLSAVRINVTVPEGFPEKYGRALVGAVNACAVKKHLHEPPAFETRVRIGDRVAVGA